MKSKKLIVKRFISTPISVTFSKPPEFSKKPSCPDAFIWQEKTYNVAECQSEWTDFSRRGRMAKNMQPQHAQVAKDRGSWGVGKFFFDIKTQGNKYYRLYYDRAPKNAFNREGNWFLIAELSGESE